MLSVCDTIEAEIASKELHYVSTTTYLWTSASGDPYITMTCHLIDSNREMKSCCLQTHYLPEDCIAVNISEVLSKTSQQWRNWKKQISWDNYGQWLKYQNSL